jgi:hypothetical protein
MKSKTKKYLLLSFIFFNINFEANASVEQILQGLEATIKVYGVVKGGYDYFSESRAAAKEGTDGKAGPVEWRLGGSATFTRLGELKEEGVLDVDKDVRILHNFNRANNQVKSLKDILEKEKGAREKLASSLGDFKSCMNNSFTMSVAARDGEKFFSHQIISIKEVRGCVDEFISTSKVIMEKLPLKDDIPFKNLPAVSSDRTTELAGGYEWHSGLSAVHSRIRELEKGGLDVQYGVRARDNFNRVRNQAIGLEQNINEMVEKRKKEAQPAECVLKTWRKILTAKGCEAASMEIFDRCYHQ